MESWREDYIRKVCGEQKAIEKKKYAIAYAETDPKNHGFIMALDQRVKIFNKNIDKEDYKGLKKELPITQWEAKGKDSGLFCLVSYPFMSFDGYIGTYKEKHPKGRLEISLEVIELKSGDLIKASIICEEGSAQGISPVGKDIEKAVSFAIRKAFAYMGFAGRWPIYSTPYGGNTDIEEFVEFKRAQKEEKKSAEDIGKAVKKRPVKPQGEKPTNKPVEKPIEKDNK